MLYIVLHTAQSASAFFFYCANKVDIAFCLDACGIQCTECRKYSCQTACIVNNTWAFDVVAFSDDFQFCIQWENCVQMSFYQNIFAAACTFADCNSVAVFVNIGFQTFFLHHFNKAFCFFFFVMCRCRDKCQFALFFQNNIPVSLDKIKGFFYFFVCNESSYFVFYVFRNLIAHSCFLSVYIINYLSNLSATSLSPSIIARCCGQAFSHWPQPIHRLAVGRFTVIFV